MPNPGRRPPCSRERRCGRNWCSRFEALVPEKVDFMLGPAKLTSSRVGGTHLGAGPVEKSTNRGKNDADDEEERQDGLGCEDRSNTRLVRQNVRE